VLPRHFALNRKRRRPTGKAVKYRQHLSKVPSSSLCIAPYATIVVTDPSYSLTHIVRRGRCRHMAGCMNTSTHTFGILQPTRKRAPRRAYSSSSKHTTRVRETDQSVVAIEICCECGVERPRHEPNGARTFQVLTALYRRDYQTSFQWEYHCQLDIQTRAESCRQARSGVNPDQERSNPSKSFLPQRDKLPCTNGGGHRYHLQETHQ
jgi:hypothetical protein